MFMKKVMLHVSIGILLVTSATVYPSQSYSESGSYVSSDSGTDSASGSESHSPALPGHNSPRTPRQMVSSIPSQRMSAAQLYVFSEGHDQIIYSREISPEVSPHLNKYSKEKRLDPEALEAALVAQKKREQIAKNCAHMFNSDDEDEIARKGIEFIKSVFSDTETPASTSRNPSPSRGQSTNPEIRIFPASGDITPDKQTSPKKSPRKKLADSSNTKILNEVEASLNDTSLSDTLPKNPANSPEISFADDTANLSQELCNLLEELKKKDASINGKSATPTDQEILELKNNANKAWEEKIQKIAKAKNNSQNKPETKTPPPAIKRSRWVMRSVCILAIAIAIFYAQKLLWSTPEKTA
jgi:hypothetical protein